ncbi:MAG TPA: phosphatase PAP2 family protein [Chitinophagaceae bacterium]|nr:phosphatase PAP2 family protein [Chitinophagaceae bacterium]
MLFLWILSLWQQVEKADQWLFLRVNHGLANPFFDLVMPFIRNGPNWAPLYLFVGTVALVNYKKQGAYWIVFFLATVALTDMTGTYLFKHIFHRLRPCNDPGFFFNVRLLVDHCSTGYSFTSNHAANHFGLATFFYVTTRFQLKKWAMLAFAWALLVAFAQVYVGVHYPLDVVGGTALGLIFGAFTGTVFNKRFGFVTFDNQPTLSS